MNHFAVILLENLFLVNYSLLLELLKANESVIKNKLQLLFTVLLCTVHYTHTYTHTHTNKDWINMQPLDRTDSLNDVF
jgi:hypothetical protein